MKVDSQVIKRYLEGQEIDGDKELIIDWFSDLSAEKSLRAEHRHYWNEFKKHKISLKGYNSTLLLSQINHAIRLQESGKRKEQRLLPKIVAIAYRVAAVLFIPLLAFLFINRNDFINTEKEISYSTLYSPPGTRTMIYLPDGSSGWLNGGSTLEFPNTFSGKTRELTLDGEAYFDVKPDRKKTFIVSGTQISAEVYGTSFNVMAYSEEKVNEVTLVSGSLKVYGKSHENIHEARMLKPDQMYVYDKRTRSSKIIPVDAKQIISWKEGKLVFERVPFSQVIKRINRWYNVEIIINDEILKSYNYLATFEDETLEEVLKLLKLSAPIDYKDFGRQRNTDGTFTKRKIEIYYVPNKESISSN